jgi:hypothetical protein
MNAMLEPRMVAAKIHGPFTAAGWKQRLLRIAASSQGGLAIVAIRPFSAESLNVGSWRETRRTIRVKQPETEHTVSVGKLSWLDGGGKSPNEQVLKSRLREML